MDSFFSCCNNNERYSCDNVNKVSRQYCVWLRLVEIYIKAPPDGSVIPSMQTLIQFSMEMQAGSLKRETTADKYDVMRRARFTHFT